MLSDACTVQAGRRQKRGLHSGKDAPLHHVNDVSLPGTGARAKQYLPFFQRGRVAGVVDFVITGHRLKASGPERPDSKRAARLPHSSRAALGLSGQPMLCLASRARLLPPALSRPVPSGACRPAARHCARA